MSDKRCTFPDCYCGGPDECGEARDAPSVRPGPVPPTMENRMKKTGNMRYRVGWFGRVILQIEWSYIAVENCGGVIDAEHATIWLDAKAEDLTEYKP